MLRAPEAAIAYARNLFMAEVEEEHRPVVYPVAVTAINHSLANYARSLVTAKRSFTLRRRGSRSTPRVEREEARGGCSPPSPSPREEAAGSSSTTRSCARADRTSVNSKIYRVAGSRRVIE